MAKEKTEIIKPKREEKEKKSLITPIIYFILGIVLAFKSNEAVTLVFYVLGIFVILFGIKSLITYYKNKEIAQFGNMHLSLGIISIILGILLMALSSALETSIRYVLGFFLIFIGISRLLSDYSYHQYKNIRSLSNILLIICGLFSIFVSNVILVIIGCILIGNAIILFWDYLKN